MLLASRKEFALKQEDKKRIKEGLRTAMLTESDGHSFYKMAALAVTDEQGKKMLELLADEELRHFQWLKHQREAILERGEFDESFVSPAPDDVKGARSIFSPALRDRLEDAQMEMSVLSIGMQLELNSIKYYEELVKKETLPEAKNFFSTLVDWEKFHYHSLCSHFDELKEDYWAKAGFSPF